ncbi:autotransporter outer membrane beta-barrel domain-containing protein [Buttiauxella selenatireducens]|uniref:Autotransporter outer membrane beta-barrel domain-containing protein n=1 Tax=Buttiauxella selenatireducens TaxID=3073902 RepID=A0ABY9S8I6_9ENTR|nr:autotransporter outer membrane beta-barrel domain-containing protein [Buttiauxella sp. R73]WMY73810.1 autotransporter outer membrane beta-barrel domain-containing protein [Buttiauxella sp. R73]
MNSVFKVIWSVSHSCFIVVSELAKSNGVKSNNSNKNIITSLVVSPFKIKFITAFILTSISGISSVNAASQVIPLFSPELNSNGVGSLTIGNSETTNLITGTYGFGGISPGQSGFVQISIRDAEKKGYLIPGSSDVNLSTVSFGGHTKDINYTDPVTGATRTIAVYDNGNFSSQVVGDMVVTINTPVGDKQYYNMRLASVTAGGTLNVDVGTKDASWATNSQNNFAAVTKETRVFDVGSQASDTNDAVLNYNSKTIVKSGNVMNFFPPAGNFYNFNSTDFSGRFTSAIGDYTVTSLNDLKNYNTALINAISNGTLSPDQYDAEFAKAYSNSGNHSIQFNTGISAGDNILKQANRDVNSFINAHGSRSIVNISNDANIQAVFSDVSVVSLTNGATLNNEGTLGVADGAAGGDYIVSARDSTVNNRGVLDAGTSKDVTNAFAGAHTAIYATGSTLVENSGVINVASRQRSFNATGVVLEDTATFNNGASGVMNIATGGEPTDALDNLYTYGVFVQGSANANNAGNIYIGRTAQSTISEATNDVDVKLPAIGMFIKSGTINNTGTIAIGKNVENAMAIKADGAGNITVKQDGIIDINGTKTAQNIGILADNGASGIVNNGKINLNGYSAVGIKLLNGSTANSTGEINIINGDISSTLKNFGGWVEGNGSYLLLNGRVNLDADNAIGLHARNGGKIDISNTGQLKLNSGKNQIGYFIYGNGSEINNSSTQAQDVSTENSTLYRIEGGANFNSNSAGSSLLKASGKDSSIIQVTGIGSKFTSAGSQSLEITGDGATGIRIEGGASGEITSNTAIIKVAGKNTTAGIVDGDYYDLDGNVITGLKGDSVLTSFATLNSSNTASGAFGYIARNGGTLNHKGTINLDQAGSTGVLISGGTLNNDGDISVNGTAVDIQGADSVVNNQSTVSAIDGNAAFQVGNNATLNLTGNGVTQAAGTAHGILLANGAKGLTVKDATIDMDSNGTGSAIENIANISGIQLTNTTINVGNGIGIHTGASLEQTNSGTINVTGSGTGILFENLANGSQTDQSLDMSDSKNLTINVQQAAGKGIVTDASTDLKTGVNVNVLDSNGGAALTVKGTTQQVEQSGVLKSKSSISPVVDINNGFVNTFINHGDIQAADKDAIAIETTNGNGVKFTNASGANILGQINLLKGDNLVTLESGSTGTDFTTDSGNDVFLLSGVKASENLIFTSVNGGGGDDTLRLQNAAYIWDRADAITGIEHIDLTSGSTLTLDGINPALGDMASDANGTGYNIDSTSRLELKSTSDLAFNSHITGNGTVFVDANNGQFNFTANNAVDGFNGSVHLTNSRFELSGLNTAALSKATLNTGSGNFTHVGNGEQHIGGLAFSGGTVSFDCVTPGNSTAAGTIKATDMNLLGRGTVQVDTGSVSNAPPQLNSQLTILEQDDAGNLIKLATSDTAVQGSAGNLTLVDKNGNVISDALNADITQQGKTVAIGTWDYRLTGGDSADGLYINYGLTQVELLSRGADSLVLNSYGKQGPSSDLSAKVTGSGDLHIDTGTGVVSLSNLDNDYSGETVVNSGTLALANDGVLGNTNNLRIENNAKVDMQGHSQKVGALNTAAGSQIILSAGSELLITDGLRTTGNTDGGTISSNTLLGSGKLIIDPSVVTVNGANSSFTGDVSVEGGSTVLLNNVSGLGDSGILNLQANDDRLTFVKQQANDTAITGQLSKQLAGSGLVELKDNADITLTADNSAFSGNFAVGSGSQLHAYASKNLGTAKVNNDGILHLTADTGWQLMNAITGTGDVEKLGAADLVVNRELSYSGTTTIQQGRWILGNNESENGKLSGNGEVNIASGATLGGNGEVTGSVNNKGTLAALNTLSGYTNQVKSTLTVGSLTNSGEIKLAGATAGNVLVVNGNYTGDNGLLSLNTVLGDDNSTTDKMVVNGDTSGSTRVQVSNLGGYGAQTNKGIEVVQVGGNSNGDFTLQGRAVAGAYDYFLNKGKSDGNWYLESQLRAPEDNKPKPEDTDNSASERVVRPEAGAYTANIAAANTMFVTTLHDRLGETNYVDALTGEEKVTSMWMRNTGGHNRFRDNTGQLKTQSNRYVLQLGGDIADWGSEGGSRTHLGVMAGYGNNSSNTRSSVTHYKADGSVNGYSVGVYGTWFANEAEYTGTYVDTWVQYNWFNNSVKGDDLASESYKSNGFTASVETGYTFKTAEFKGSKGSTNTVYVQPHAQAVWMGVKADPHTEANGTRVGMEGDGNLMTRLGVRTYLRGHNQMDNGKGREFEPFVEANWIHNSKSFGTTMNSDFSSMAGAKDIAELKIGVEGKINNSLNIWGNVGSQIGSHGYSDSAAMIGVKYNF